MTKIGEWQRLESYRDHKQEVIHDLGGRDQKVKETESGRN